MEIKRNGHITTISVSTTRRTSSYTVQGARDEWVVCSAEGGRDRWFSSEKAAMEAAMRFAAADAAECEGTIHFAPLAVQHECFLRALSQCPYTHHHEELYLLDPGDVELLIAAYGRAIPDLDHRGVGGYSPDDIYGAAFNARATEVRRLADRAKGLLALARHDPVVDLLNEIFGPK